MAHQTYLPAKLYGPFLLKELRIDTYLLPGSPGIYVLGYVREGGFMISCLGRSDADLKTDLKMHVRGPYQQFKFAYATSREDAFQKQCELYHECITLENHEHPRPPSEKRFACPCCRVFRPAGRVLAA